MQLNSAGRSLACLFALGFATLSVHAENGVYTGSGGSFAASTTVGQHISAQNVSLAGTTATISLQCPITSFGAGAAAWNWACAGGSITITSTDNSLSFSGTLVSGSMTYSGGGGGRGGTVHYSHSFSGTLSGTVALGSVTQRAYGSVAFHVASTSTTAGTITALSFGWNSAYGPVLVASGGSARLLQADNLTGAHLVSYGSWGSGTGQFETISGLSHDASGRIFICDSTLNRLVRINDMTGANWTELGSLGTGNLHFRNPAGVQVDASGKIWVADVGNNRIVRFDDMTGANWTSFGSAGSGANQFFRPTAIAFDSLGRIYVADEGNGRLVRFDNLSGKNWTTLSTIAVSPYAYGLTGIYGVAVLSSGRIVVSTATGSLFGFDDMTGTNAHLSFWTPSIAGMSVDPAGSIFLAGGFTPGLAETADSSGIGWFAGTMGQPTLQASAVLSLAKSVGPPAAPILSARSLAFGSQNVAEIGPSKNLLLTNIGASPLEVNSIAADSEFKVADHCPASLPGGASCNIGLQFDPAATGSRSSTLAVSTNGVHPVLDVQLSGIGTQPHAVIVPTSAMHFQPQQINTASHSEIVTVTNTGTGPLTFKSIATSGDFAVSNPCPAILAAGSGCTLSLTFKPTATGQRAGSLTFSDDAVPGGTTQSVSLSGAGASNAPLLTLTPESLYFPAQQVGVPSLPQTFTVTNGTASAVPLSSAVFSPGFTGTSTCGTLLAAHGSCSISIRFAPKAAGSVNQTVSLPVSGQPALTGGVAGTGVASATPALAVSPAPLAFGALQVGDNPALNLAIVNEAGVPVGIQSAVLTGAHEFSVTRNSCPNILAGKASCTLQITFQPDVAASFAGAFTVTESSGAVTKVPVTGSATVNGN